MEYYDGCIIAAMQQLWPCSIMPSLVLCTKDAIFRTFIWWLNPFLSKERYQLCTPEYVHSHSYWKIIDLYTSEILLGNCRAKEGCLALEITYKFILADISTAHQYGGYPLSSWKLPNLGMAESYKEKTKILAILLVEHQNKSITCIRECLIAMLDTNRAFLNIITAGMPSPPSEQTKGRLSEICKEFDLYFFLLKS